MAESTSIPPTPQQDDDADDALYLPFHEHRWDLDKDFLGGLVLALGGYHALARTASQADIIMHSRIFYYARIRGATVPYAGYRAWLRRQHQQSLRPRIWEWDLLEAICRHRDRMTAASAAAAEDGAAVAAEKAEWMRELLGGDDDGVAAQEAAGTPAWMAAAPKGELYVDRDGAAAGGGGGGGGGDGNPGGDDVPYPEKFAAIIKAVQSGEQIEGILEIPDVVVRNPDTTPFGKMTRPLKPWERAQPAGNPTAEAEHTSALDQSFPDQEEGAA